MLLFDLSNSKANEELSNLVGFSQQDVIKKMNIDAILELPILDFNKMAAYSYFILRRESERYYLQVFLQILIPDFKTKSKDFDKNNTNFIHLKEVNLNSF